MYQENNQRKWQTSSVSNPPLENLKTFLQKRIRTIMAKEWWDFIVNVNTLNSDHASLLYSLANLCPSFNYFLQTRDKELQLIIKKRPVVKPRIFSGSERLDTTPEPIVPKQLPLVTRRNSATELVKILNELYPNESTSKSKQPRTYGPASKQKKPPGGPSKKNVITNNITGEVTKKSNPAHATIGRTPLLKRLLADESQKENAHITNVKKMPQLLSLPVLLEDDENFSKNILSNTNYDLNQNRLNQSPKKIKKIIKVKKKRYVYSNALTDSKNRLKYILEDETPSLSLKLIKKYRIKKCTVNVVRLKDSVLKYYEELRLRNFEKLSLSLEESPSSIPNEEMQLSTSDITDQHNNLNVTSNSPTAVLPSEKDEEVSEKNCSNSGKENAPVVEILNPKELKSMYCHGGIVPLGKLLMSDKIGNNKHFLSLKEKKIRENSNDAATFLKPKDVNPKIENNEIETKNCNSNNILPDLDSLHSFESVTKDSPINALKSDKVNDCVNKAVSDGNDSSNGTDTITHKESEIVQQIPVEQIRKSPNLELENSKSLFEGATGSEKIDVDESLVPVSDNSCSKNVSNVDNDPTESTLNNCNENVRLMSESSLCEAPEFSNEKHLDINDVELTIPSEMSDEAVIPEIESVGNNKSETNSESLVQQAGEGNRTILEKLISDTLLSKTEDLEPLAKRPRIEINLTEMKLVTEITKTLVESDNNDDRVCKMCKSSFESVESWNEHFENKVPKCTPNLQMTWDNPELSLLTD